jgi:hypothetical protein
MMNMAGRWYTKNKTLVAVHLNGAALPGNREERWIGHSIGLSPELKVCWNENGECVWVMGIVDDTKKYDLIECISGKDITEAKVKVVGCKECKNG